METEVMRGKEPDPSPGNESTTDGDNEKQFSVKEIMAAESFKSCGSPLGDNVININASKYTDNMHGQGIVVRLEDDGVIVETLANNTSLPPAKCDRNQVPDHIPSNTTTECKAESPKPPSVFIDSDKQEENEDSIQRLLNDVIDSVVRQETLKVTGACTEVSGNSAKSGSSPNALGSPRLSKRKRMPKKVDYIEEEKETAKPVPIVKEKVPLIETQVQYAVADLVWSYVPGHPLWPCMITKDPVEQLATKMHGGGPKGVRVYHVQFLGDSPERGWITENRVFPFADPSDYERIIKELAIKHKKVRSKIPRLEIPIRLKDDWESGISEIVEAVGISAEERIERFGYDFKPFVKSLKKLPHAKVITLDDDFDEPYKLTTVETFGQFSRGEAEWRFLEKTLELELKQTATDTKLATSENVFPNQCTPSFNSVSIRKSAACRFRNDQIRMGNVGSLQQKNPKLEATVEAKSSHLFSSSADIAEMLPVDETTDSTAMCSTKIAYVTSIKSEHVQNNNVLFPFYHQPEMESESSEHLSEHPQAKFVVSEYSMHIPDKSLACPSNNSKSFKAKKVSNFTVSESQIVSHRPVTLDSDQETNKQSSKAAENSSMVEEGTCDTDVSAVPMSTTAVKAELYVDVMPTDSPSDPPLQILASASNLDNLSKLVVADQPDSVIPQAPETVFSLNCSNDIPNIGNTIRPDTKCLELCAKSDDRIISNSPSKHLIPCGIKLKARYMGGSSDDMDFTALAKPLQQDHKPNQTLATDSGYDKSLDNAEIDGNTASGVDVDGPHHDQAQIFRDLLGLKRTYISENNRAADAIINKEKAEKVVAALNTEYFTPENYEQCSCSALNQKKRGTVSRNGSTCVYTIRELLDALRAVENGFSLPVVVSSFNIPKPTLQAYLKRNTALTLRHHTDCKMFPDGKYVLSSPSVTHIRALEDCRRLQLMTNVKPLTSSSFNLKKLEPTPSLTSEVCAVRKEYRAENTLQMPDHSTSTSSSVDYDMYSKKQLVVIWKNYTKKFNLRRYQVEYNCSKKNDCSELGFKRALKMAVYGKGLKESALSCNVNLNIFFRRLKYFYQLCNENPAEMVSSHGTILGLLHAFDDILSGEQNDCQKTADKHKISVKVLMDFIRWNRKVYQKMIKPSMVKLARLGILQDHWHLFCSVNMDQQCTEVDKQNSLSPTGDILVNSLSSARLTNEGQRCYTQDAILSALDEVLSGDMQSLTKTAQEHNMPLSTLRDCVTRNTDPYNLLIKEGTPREQRLKILHENIHSFRFRRGFAVATADLNISKKQNESVMPSKEAPALCKTKPVSIALNNAALSTKSTENETKNEKEEKTNGKGNTKTSSLLQRNKMRRIFDVKNVKAALVEISRRGRGSLTSVARRYNIPASALRSGSIKSMSGRYSSFDMVRAVIEVNFWQKNLKHVARKYNIPPSTLHDQTTAARKFETSSQPQPTTSSMFKPVLANMCSDNRTRSCSRQQGETINTNINKRTSDNLKQARKSPSHYFVTDYKIPEWKNRYSAIDLSKAVEEVLQGQVLNQVSRKYNIPTSTLRDNAFGRRNSLILRLHVTEEQKLVKSIKDYLSWGWKFTTDDLRKIIAQYLEQNRPGTRFNKDQVSSLWLKYFCQRNEITCILSRISANKPDPFEIFSFFDILENSLKTLNLKDAPCNVYLIYDFTLVLSKVNEIRIVAAVNAAGGKYPPLIIFKGKSIFCSNQKIFPGSQFALSDDLSLNENIFVEWFDNLTRVIPTRPLLLLYDGTLETLPLQFEQAARNKNTVILKLPYSTEKSTFKLPYSEVVSDAKQWYKDNVFGTKTKFATTEIAQSVSNLWKNSISPEVISTTFDTSGFFPVNREKYPVETFCEEKLREYGRMQSTNFISRRSSLRSAQSSIASSASVKINTTTSGQEPEGDKIATASDKPKVKETKPLVKQLNIKSSGGSNKLRRVQKQVRPGLDVAEECLALGIKEAKSRKTTLFNHRKKNPLPTVNDLGKQNKTDNTDLFNNFCEKRRPPLLIEKPNLTAEQIESLIWMEWELLSPELQRRFGARRPSDQQRAANTPSSPKRKRGRPLKTAEPQSVLLPTPTSTSTTTATPGSNEDRFVCSSCNAEYASKVSLGQHKRWCQESGSNKNGSAKKKIFDSVDNEETTTYRSFTCSNCQDKFHSSKSLEIHKKFCSGLTKDSDKSSSGTPKRHSSKMPVTPSRRSKGSTPDDSSSNGSKPDSDDVTNQRKIRMRGPQLGSMTKRENVCLKCEQAGENMLTCVGGCCRSVHKACTDDPTPEGEQYTCTSCKNDCHACFICKKGKEGNDTAGLGEIKRCNVQHCGRYYHTTCLQVRKISILSSHEDSGTDNGDRHSLMNSTRCTLHNCATCISKSADEALPQGNGARCRMFKCVRCPTAYHTGDDCIAAGSVILPGLNIICPQHFEPMKSVPHHQPVHVSWCFICSKGGELICCDSCPAAFHPACVDMKDTPDGEWFCRDCRHQRKILYGDIVWVKLGSYRWWPGQVTHPNDIPDNIQNLRHGIGEFVVNFFGSNDYFWLNRKRVFHYQEGDTGASTATCSRGISSVFNKAVKVAQEKFELLTSQRQKVQDEKSQKQRAVYKFVKTNKPVGNVQVYTADLSEIARCICKRTDPNPCGPESECLNRMLMYECHPNVCPAGDKCQNQHFQKRDYPPSEVFKTTWGGWGLRTKVPVKKGEFVNEYVGELVDNEECLRRIEQAHKNNVTNFYMLTIDKDRIIDAGPKGNFSRFMNHSCDPSCETQKWAVNGDTRVGLFARCDILAGQELTFNYNLDCLGNDKTPCMCGSNNCSGFIGVRPKPQIGNGSNGNQKNKRKRKRADSRLVPKHDDFCFRCRQTGTLVCCDVRACQRAFCLSCLRLTKPPFGKWECPWHHCDFCGRRAQSFCHFCPNSFCASHVNNQLIASVPNKYDCCTDHNPHVAEYEMEEAIAAVVASMMHSWEENPLSFPIQTSIESTDKNAKEETSSSKAEEPTEMKEEETPSKRKRGRPKRNTDVTSTTECKIAKFKALSPPQVSESSEAQATESDSDDDLGPPTSSPVKRKRLKTQYFRGKKKRRKSKTSSRDPPAHTDQPQGGAKDPVSTEDDDNPVEKVKTESNGPTLNEVTQ
ncbi:uncharacterized protein LOC143470047 isoform X2 [Clavelina lepadiformis]|uniref:uncharacterized protein LOC143470047 isoform X2 n=1 Tax=Clavelina lepadiformis TaxID=159417 RepID=UPI004041A01C